jgi:hypothetical protein
MATYTANTSNNIKHYVISNGEQELGSLIYPKWYSFDAQVSLANGKAYYFKSKGVWQNKIELWDQDNNLSDINYKMGWTGMVIDCVINGIPRSFMHKHKGLMGNKYVLIDEEKNELLSLEAKYKYKGLNLSINQTIQTDELFESMNNNNLLLFTVIHCTSYYLAAIMGS